METKFCVLFVGDVANSSGQVEITVNSSLDVNSGASFIDTVSFLLESWLVIHRKWNSSAAFTKDTSRISGISTDK